MSQAWFDAVTRRSGRAIAAPASPIIKSPVSRTAARSSAEARSISAPHSEQ